MNLSNEELAHLYREMLVYRAIEEQMISQTPGWHSAIGEEGSYAGAFFGLGKDDYVCPSHRGGYGVHYLKGLPLVEVFGEMYGRAIGPGRGKGLGLVGTMKYGIIPWCAGGLGPLLLTSTGVALAAKLKKKDSVVVIAFGDGTSSRGEFHEALNFASILKLPIVYVCVNNQWAMSMRVEKFIAVENIADRARGYSMPGVMVDGNDVLAVHEAVHEATTRARRGEGPSLIECKTYRLSGHMEADPALYMPKEEVEAWQSKDPIKRLCEYLIQKGLLTEQKAEEYSQEAKAEVEKAFKEAVEGPRPERDKDFVLSGVFAP